MVYFPVRKYYYVTKVSLLLILVVSVLGLFETWRGGKRAASAINPYEQEYERQILEDEARIVPGLGEGGVAAYLTGKDLKLGEQSKKKLAMNVYLSDRIAYNRTLKDKRNPACAQVTYDAELPSASVILVFHNEPYSVLIRTIWSVINSCRRENPWLQKANYIDSRGRPMNLGYPGQEESSPLVYLKEIILVDDNSTLPELKGKLSHYVRTKLPPDLIRILRLPDRVGLTRAQLVGARLSMSSVLVFLDCHCEAQTDWLRPQLQAIKDHPHAVVMPIIDTIDQSNFLYSTKENSEFQVGGFTFTGHFKWIDVSPEEKKRRGSEISPTWSPTMAGGLFAIKRAFFWQLGAYDERMAGWGGENLEMSFRIWQCGGTIETIPCSRIGHVYRSFHPYRMAADSDTHGVNTARMAEVWMDEYAELFYLHRPDLRNNSKIGDVTHRKALREDLRCKNFQWFLDNIYKDKFVPVRDAYGYGRFRNPASNLCIDTLQREGAEHPLGVYQCHPTLQATQYLSLSLSHQLRDEETCAQIQFNSVGSSGSYLQGHKVVMANCNGTREQEWQHLQPSKQLQHVESRLCLDAGNKSGADLVARPCSDANTQRWLIDYSEDNHFNSSNEVVPSDSELKLSRLRGLRVKSQSHVSYSQDQRRYYKNPQPIHPTRSKQIKTKNKFILKVVRTLMNDTEEHLEMDVHCKHRQLFPNNSFVRDLVTILNERNIKVINNGRLFERNKTTKLDSNEVEDTDTDVLNVLDTTQEDQHEVKRKHKPLSPLLALPPAVQGVEGRKMGGQIEASSVEELFRKKHRNVDVMTSDEIIEGEGDNPQSKDKDSNSVVWNDGESRSTTEELGSTHDTLETEDIEYSTRESETEHGPKVTYTKYRKHLPPFLEIQRYGSMSESWAPALPPVFQSVADAEKAFDYCAERAEHYVRELQGDTASIDALKEVTYCANVAHIVKSTVKNCDLVAAACSNISASDNEHEHKDYTYRTAEMGRRHDTTETGRHTGHSTRKPETEQRSSEAISNNFRKPLLFALQRDGIASKRSFPAMPPIVQSVADAADGFGFCAARAERYARKRADNRALYIEAARDFTNCANIAHSVKAAAKGCDLAAAYPPHATETAGSRQLDGDESTTNESTTNESTTNESTTNESTTNATMSTTMIPTSTQATTTTTDPVCGGNGYEYSNVTGHCYKLYTEEMRWPKAKKSCIGDKGHLAVINSHQEALLLADVAARDNKLKIGFIGVFRDSAGRWKTVTGEDINKAAGYDLWETPKNKLFRYGFILSTGLMGTAIDTFRAPFICERAPSHARTHRHRHNHTWP